jgi:hypothetical protein
MPLARIRDRLPCTADWSKMNGGCEVRFCTECKLHVHDPQRDDRRRGRGEAAPRRRGRLCVRFYRRADGTVLTQDCPVGWRRRVAPAWSARRWRWRWLCSARSPGCTRRAVETPPPAGATLPAWRDRSGSRRRPPDGRAARHDPTRGRVEMGDMGPRPRSRRWGRSRRLRCRRAGRRGDPFPRIRSRPLLFRSRFSALPHPFSRAPLPFPSPTHSRSRSRSHSRLQRPLS